MEPNVAYLLTQNAGVAAIIDDRAYLQRMPQQNFDGPKFVPCAVIQRIASRETQTFCGSDELTAASYQVDAYATDPDTAIDLASAIRAALVDYCGDVQGCWVARIFRESAFDAAPETEPGLYRRIQTFTVWHQES